jgi:hypothetical protein
MRVKIILFFLFIGNISFSQDILISPLTYITYENNVFTKVNIDLKPELGAAYIGDSIFYEIKNDKIVRYFFNGNRTLIEEFSVIERIKYIRIEKIYAESKSRQHLEISLFSDKNAVIIYHDDTLIRIEEAIYQD